MQSTFLSLLLLLPFSASAQDWFYVSESDTASHFVDSDSIKNRSDYVQAWLMTENKKPLEGVASSKGLYRIRCEDEELALMSITEFSGPRGSGQPLESGSLKVADYRPVSPGSVAGGFVDIVCNLNEAALDGAREGAKAADEVMRMLRNGD